METQIKMVTGIRKSVWLLIMLLILAAAYKYVAYPEPYTFQTALPADRLELASNTFTQDIIIDSAAKWSSGAYYSLYFITESPLTQGYIEVSLSQMDKKLGRVRIEAADIVNGYYRLDDLDYSKLEYGTATISIRGVNLLSPVYLGVVPNQYNIPNLLVNQKDTQLTLAQTYHYYILKREWLLRKMVFWCFVIINIFSVAVVLKKENKKTCLLTQLGLMASYISLSFIYDSSIFLSPTWAEAVTNFMDRAINLPFFQNFLESDAGYLPLLQRCLTLFVIRVLRIVPYCALGIMQLAAYIIAGYALSFFCKVQYRKYVPLQYRYLLSLILITQIISRDTGTFINFVVYGIFIILFYFLADSEEWTKPEFVFLCMWGLIACLSKGSYVPLFPFFILCMIMFHRSFSWRDKIFTLSCISGAFLQLVYYLFQGNSWFDRKNSITDAHYVAKLVCSIIIDVPNNILSLFGTNASLFNGISILIIILFWSGMIYLFMKHVVIKLARKERIENNFRNFFMMLILIAAQGLFFRITVYGMSEYDILSDDFWTFINRGTGDRYQVFIWAAVICWFIACIKILSEKNKNIKLIEKGVVLAFGICFVINIPRLSLKGINNDTYAADRIYLRDLDAEYDLLKGIENVKCRAVPIQPNGWCYRKNASVYYLGTNIFGWTSMPIDEKAVVSSGKVSLKKFPSINSKVKIWQIFVARPALVNNKVWQVVLKDRQGKEILRMNQDNTNYQKIVSFTFDEGIHHIGTVEILDSDGNRVNIQNGMYFVTWETSEFIKNTHMGGAVT